MSETIALRVRVHEAWDDVHLALPAHATVADVKHRVLEIVGEQDAPDEFVIKFRGIELRDEMQTLADAGLPEDAALIVLRRRRRAVR